MSFWSLLSLIVALVFVSTSFALSPELTQRYQQRIEPILAGKCKDCHTPHLQGESVYGSIPVFGGMIDSSVQQHIDDGLEKFEFVAGSTEFKAGQVPSANVQRALLLRLKSSTVNNTMPLSSYLITHPGKRLTAAEKEEIIAYVDAAVAEIDAENGSANNIVIPTNQVGEQVISLFNASCSECHGNGNSDGGLDQITDIAHLIQNGYIKPGNPAGSMIFRAVEAEMMPPQNPLTEAQIDLIEEYIQNLEGPAISNASPSSSASELEGGASQGSAPTGSNQ